MQSEYEEAQYLTDFIVASLLNGVSSAMAVRSGFAAFFRNGKWVPSNSPKNRRLPSSEWTALRLQILERDAFECAYCGNDADCVDHILPLCRGGTNDAINLAASCTFCNSSKGGKLLSEWRRPA